MSGRSWDEERATLLSDREPGGGESSSSRGSEEQQPLQPARLPSSTTAIDDDDDEDSPHNRRPRVGGCSKSTTVTLLLVMMILVGLVVFLMLSPSPDREYWMDRMNQSDSAAAVLLAAEGTDSGGRKTAANRTQEEADDDEVGAKKSAILHQDAPSMQKPMSRMERMEKWFMKRPMRSLTDYVLFGNEPQHYMVFLRAQIRGWNGADQSSLDGEVNITLTHTGGDPRRIELNSLHNMIAETHVYRLTSKGPLEIACRFSLDRRRERLVVETAEPLLIGGEYLLQIFYRTSPDLRMRGAYESWLWDESKGRKVYSMHVTNQPMDARRWLPCFDEPRFKASLTLLINHPSGLNAVANSGLDWKFDTRKSPEGRNRSTSVFLPTPPLSSYLFSFSVNNYKQYSVVKDGVKYTTLLGRRGEQLGNKSVHMLLDAVADINALYPGWMLLSPANGDNYTAKLDMVYSPDHTGAMENHGLIICEDARLVAYRVMSMIRHEVAHHIFGNRITLRWWSDMWLNEGLTSKAEYEADYMRQLAHLTGEERRIKEDEYFFEQSREAMRFDVYESSAPLSDPSVLSREEAKYQFSNAYVKGASVLRMFSKLDEIAYNRTIEFLLVNRSLANFDRKDFCDLYGGFSESNASTAICDDFSLQRNYPILIVRKVKGGYEVRQRRFHRGYVDETYRDDTTRFTIPLAIRWKIPHTELWGPVERKVMWREDDVIFIEADAPIVINGDGQYYYRVIYDDYKPFYAVPNSTKPDAAWRLQQTKLLDDATGAMLSGYIEPALALRFAINCGLEMPSSFFSLQFKNLLYRHLYRQELDEWEVMDIVEQLFDRSESAPAYWFEPQQTRSVCGKEAVNTSEKALDAYTKGKLFGSNSEGLYLLECARNSNTSFQQVIDWMWSSLSAYDDTIRSKDVNLAFQLAIDNIGGDVDTVMRAINKKAYNIKISDDDFAFIVARVFSYLSSPINGATISHLVKLRPDSMRAEWNLVARVAEEERMNDLEHHKLGPDVLDALLKVLQKDRAFDVTQLIRKTSLEEKIRNRGIRNKPEKETLQAFSDTLVYPAAIQEGINPREVIVSSRGRRKRRGLKRTKTVAPSKTTEVLKKMRSMEERNSTGVPPIRSPTSTP